VFIDALLDGLSGSVRLGTTPLHFAVFSQQISFVKLILEKLCNSDLERLDVLWDKDNSGNMVLHMAVMAGSIDIYDYLRHSFLHLESLLLKGKSADGRVLKSIQSDLHTKNALNLTPLELAALLGKHELLCHMINLDVVTIWEYNDFSLKGFAMRDIDTFKTLALNRWQLAQQVYRLYSLALHRPQTYSCLMPLCVVAHALGITRRHRQREQCVTKSGFFTVQAWVAWSTWPTSGCALLSPPYAVCAARVTRH
jgi:hypothetical protein